MQDTRLFACLCSNTTINLCNQRNTKRHTQKNVGCAHIVSCTISANARLLTSSEVHPKCKYPVNASSSAQPANCKKKTKNVSLVPRLNGQKESNVTNLVAQKVLDSFQVMVGFLLNALDLRRVFSRKPCANVLQYATTVGTQARYVLCSLEVSYALMHS